MIGYFDTSALVKLLLAEEDGVETAANLWDAAAIAISSRLAYPEARAALAAAHRARRLSAPQLTESAGELARLFGQLVVVEIEARLAEAAGEVAEQFGLRANDAVHLASALAVADSQTVVVTWDGHLANAARRSGLGVSP